MYSSMLIRNASASSAIVSIRPFFVVPHSSAQIVDMGTPEIRDSCAADNLALLRALRIFSPLVIPLHRPSSRRSYKSRPNLRGRGGLSTIPAAAYCRIGSDGSAPPAQRQRPTIGVLLLLPQKRVLSPCTRQF